MGAILGLVAKSPIEAHLSKEDEMLRDKRASWGRPTSGGLGLDPPRRENTPRDRTGTVAVAEEAVSASVVVERVYADALSRPREQEEKRVSTGRRSYPTRRDSVRTTLSVRMARPLPLG